MLFHTFYLFPDNTSVTTATSPVYSNPIDQAMCYQTQGILSVQWARTGGDCTIDVLGCNDPAAMVDPDRPLGHSEIRNLLSFRRTKIRCHSVDVAE